MTRGRVRRRFGGFMGRPILCCSLALVAAFAQASERSGPLPSPEALQREFDGICDRSRRGSDPFVGEAVLAELEERLAAEGKLR